MVVEVVLAQIGENRRVQPGAVEPPFVEAYRRGLHHHRVQPLVGVAAQQGLQRHRVRRGKAGAGELSARHAGA